MLAFCLEGDLMPLRENQGGVAQRYLEEGTDHFYHDGNVLIRDRRRLPRSERRATQRLFIRVVEVLMALYGGLTKPKR